MNLHEPCCVTYYCHPNPLATGTSRHWMQQQHAHDLSKFLDSWIRVGAYMRALLLTPEPSDLAPWLCEHLLTAFCIPVQVEHAHPPAGAVGAVAWRDDDVNSVGAPRQCRCMRVSLNARQ